MGIHEGCGKRKCSLQPDAAHQCGICSGIAIILEKWGPPGVRTHAKPERGIYVYLSNEALSSKTRKTRRSVGQLGLQDIAECCLIYIPKSL